MMIKPAYFPLTCISASVAEHLYRIFGGAILYQPVYRNVPEKISEFEKNGKIEIRVPQSDNEEQLVELLKEFKEWGALHQQDGASLKEFFKKGPGSEAFTAQVRTDILKDGNPADPAPDIGYMHRLFLMMAQDFDIQQIQIDQDMAATVDDELDLFTSMTGEEAALTPSQKLTNSDCGAYMTDSRLAAWFYLLKNDDRPPVLLVTDSRSSLDVICEEIQEIIPVHKFESIPTAPGDIQKKAIDDYFKKLSSTPRTESDSIAPPDFEPDSGTDTVSMELFMLPRKSPEYIYNQLTNDKDPASGLQPQNLNTLIGFFEM